MRVRAVAPDRAIGLALHDVSPSVNDITFPCVLVTTRRSNTIDRRNRRADFDDHLVVFRRHCIVAGHQHATGMMLREGSEHVRVFLAAQAQRTHRTRVEPPPYEFTDEPFIQTLIDYEEPGCPAHQAAIAS